MSEHVWYFLKESFGGESQEGPLTEPQFVQLVKKGHLKKQTKICSPTRTKGQWTTVEQVPSIAKLIEQGKLERAQEKAAKSAPAAPHPPRPPEPPANHPAESTPAPMNPRISGHDSSSPSTPQSTVGQYPAVAQPKPSTPFEAPTTISAIHSGFQPRNYPWLSTVRYAFYVLAGLAAISMLVWLVLSIISIIALIGSEFSDLIWMAIYGAIINIFSHTTVILILVFLANLIKLMIDVQTNTQLTAFNTSQSAPRQ